MGTLKQNTILYLALALSWVLAGCSQTYKYPIAEPITSDPDNVHLAEAPDESDPNYIWDKTYCTIFYPALEGIDNLFGVLGTGEAKNVNSYGEVPDSSWFTNRICM